MHVCTAMPWRCIRWWLRRCRSWFLESTRGRCHEKAFPAPVLIDYVQMTKHWRGIAGIQQVGLLDAIAGSQLRTPLEYPGVAVGHRTQIAGQRNLNATSDCPWSGCYR
jgi:hypothetical protein